MNKPFRLRYVSEIVGAFVALVMILILTILGGVIHRQGWLTPEFAVTTHISQDDTDGLNKGASVVLLGKEIGKVESIRYDESAADPTRNVEVTMYLKDTYRDQIFVDSVAKLRRRIAGTGEAFFDIARGNSPTRKVIEPDAEITYDKEPSTTSEVENIVDSVDDISTNVGEAERNFAEVTTDFSSIQEDFAKIQTNFFEVKTDFSMVKDDFRLVRENTDMARDDFKRIAETALIEFPSISSNIKDTRIAVEDFQASADRTFLNLESNWETIAANSGKMSHSISDVSENISNDMRDIRESAVPAFIRLEDSATSFGKASEDLQQLVSEVRETNERLQPILQNADTFFKDATEISATVKVEVQQLPGTVKKVQNTLDDAEVIAGGLKRHKLLRRYVDQGNGSREIAPARVGRGGL